MKRAMSRMMRLGLAMAGAGLLAACGDDPVAPPGGDELSAAEAAAISAFLVGESFEGWEFGQVGGPSASIAPSRSAGAPITIDFSTQVSAACPEGGSIALAVDVQGTVDDETQSGTLSLFVSESLDACAFSAEGTVFTLDTSPDLELDGDFAWQAGEPVGEQSFTFAGGLLWEAADGRAGSCAVDLEVTLFEDGSTLQSGTICGSTLGA